MTLEELGYSERIGKLMEEGGFEGFEPGRVLAEHKERYIVAAASGEYEAEITGNLRFSAENREDFPAVGDWVALTACDSDFAVIHAVLPRYSIIKRRAVGQFGEVQVIGANIDYAFLVQAVDRDFNINRLERYLTICNSSRVEPVILLTKTDLAEEAYVAEITGSIRARIASVPVVAVSNSTRNGYETLTSLIESGRTYCMLGSSGVGKSTLLNNLTGRDMMRTDSISQSTNKGRHVTSHRELTVLDNGGILIDNPGMREVGIADTADGLEVTFDIIAGLAGDCKYKDCTHTQEDGCAVLEALDNGEIDRGHYENYLKIEKERSYFESSLVERRKKDKDFGKMLKNYKKDKKRNNW